MQDKDGPNHVANDWIMLDEVATWAGGAGGAILEALPVLRAGQNPLKGIASMSTILSLTEAQSLIEAADPGIFVLETETGLGDRRSLLALQHTVRRGCASYVYVEVGSYMGGTLVPHLMDPRCALVISIDKRVGQQTDERSISFDYTRSNTALMLQRLEASLPFCAMLKLVTYDSDASAIPDEARASRFDLAFIDAEHTNRAAFEDFLSLYRFAAESCIIAFHDANLIVDALANVESFLRFSGVRFEGLVLPDSIFAVLLGKYASVAAPLARHAVDKEHFFNVSKENLWRAIAQLRASTGC
jgi:hypothetical protein